MHSLLVINILQKAIEVEKDGAEFYRKLARQTTVTAVSEAFLKLAADEEKHQRDFASLAVAMKGVVIESAIDLLGVLTQVSSRLRECIRGSELLDMSGVNLSQAINIGIHNEQEAIKLYSSLLEIVHPEFNLVIRKVIKEEQGHLLILENCKKDRLG